MAERRCKNWLIEFGKWTLPKSEAPETFIAWTGLFILSSVLKRRVFVPKKYLGSWSCAPNLYILFVAPAGKARKSTTANYAEELLECVPSLTRSPELITKEAVLDKLVKSNDASMCIIAPEFGEFIAKSGPSMFGFLTNMYDGKKHISGATMIRGNEFAEKPCINLIGATTPEWIAENMPESAIGGGFASRVIFIFEERVRRRKILYDDLDHAALDNIERNLVTDLIHIAENISGEFSLDDSARNFIEQWYDTSSGAGDDASYKLSGYFERKPAHVLKVAQILHVAHSDDLVLTSRDLEDAIALIEQVEIRLPKVFQSIGRNPYTVDAYRILDYIVSKGSKVSSIDINRHFMSSATPTMLKEIMDSLGYAGYITVAPEGDTLYYKASPSLKVTNGRVSRSKSTT